MQLHMNRIDSLWAEIIKDYPHPYCMACGHDFKPCETVFFVGVWRGKWIKKKRPDGEVDWIEDVNEELRCQWCFNWAVLYNAKGMIRYSAGSKEGKLMRVLQKLERVGGLVKAYNDGVIISQNITPVTPNADSSGMTQGL
jgi:hypothetical protein